MSGTEFFGNLVFPNCIKLLFYWTKEKILSEEKISLDYKER